MEFCDFKYFLLLLSLWTTVMKESSCQKAQLTMVDDKCISSATSAMAMIYNISKFDTTEINNWKDISSEHDATQNLCKSAVCFQGKHSLTNSFEPLKGINNLITDWRWEDFRTVITNHTEDKNELLDYQYAADLPFSDDYTIPISVQVKCEAHIFLCDGDEVPSSNCIWFMLQAWKGEASASRICRRREIQERYDGNVPLGQCNNSTKRSNHQRNDPKYLSENHWTHLRIVKEGPMYRIEKQNGEKIIERQMETITPRKLFFHTKFGYGLWKVHKFDYIFIETGNDKLEVLLKKPKSNCLSMFVAMCPTCKMDIENLSVEGSAYRVNGTNQDQKWKEVKLRFTQELNDDNVNLEIKVSANYENAFWAIDGITECNDGFRIIRAKDPTIWSGKCQLIETGSILEKTGDTSVLKNWKNCKEDQFGEDCFDCRALFDERNCSSWKNRKYCQLIKDGPDVKKKCFCSIGSSGNRCQDDCPPRLYGHGCQRKCDNCQNTCSKDPVNGTCNVNNNGHILCSDNYIGNKCDGIQVCIFKDLPKLEVGYTSVNMSMSNFDIRNSCEQPKYIMFQYKEANGSEWRNVSKQDIGFTDKVSLKALRKDTHYAVRVIGFVSDEDLRTFNHVPDIPQKPFTTMCTELTENDIGLKTNETDVEFWIKLEQYKDKKYHCDISEYKFQVNSSTVSGRENKYSVKNLQPFTKYEISVIKNEDTKFKMPFKTKESVPEHVQQFIYEKTKNPSELILRWSKPSKTNGDLLFYEVSFQVIKYLACDQNATESSLTKSIRYNGSDIRVEWPIDFLKPYAWYRIEIRANTSVGYGPPTDLQLHTNEIETLPKEEVPKIEINPGVKNCTVQFSLSPCENMTGPIYVDTVFTCLHSWCPNMPVVSRKTNLKPQSVFGTLTPFSNHSVTFSFYRSDTTAMINITKLFKTKPSEPNPVRQLEIFSKSEHYISLRWLPPFPPTGVLKMYKIHFDSDKQKGSFDVDPKPCNFWPEFHCAVIRKLKMFTYQVQVQARNNEPEEYSNNSSLTNIWTTSSQLSEPPYGLQMFWCADNSLQLSWNHPNFTCGTISSFKIYVNKLKTEYSIGSEANYSSNYSMKIKKGLEFPDDYVVNVTTCNLKGESFNTSITGNGPPPIPDDHFSKVKHKGTYIYVTLSKMKCYKKKFDRFVYLLISECGDCQDEIDSLEKDLLKYHEDFKTPKSPNSIDMSQWKLVRAYKRDNKTSKTLNVGPQTTNTTVNEVEYSLGLIVVYRLNGYVRANHTIFNVGIESRPSVPVPLITTVIIVVLFVIFVSLVLIYISKRRRTNQIIRQVFYSRRNIEENNYANQVNDEFPLISHFYNGKDTSEMRKNKKPETICPGNPLFTTKHSRRVKLDNFPQYVKEVILSDELAAQHSIFPHGLTMPCNVACHPDNKKKNRYNNLYAYDHSRVILQKIDWIEHSDYINANYIDGYQSPRAYIATQGPKKNTVQDFWRMVWQENVTHIVMMANVYEGGKIKTEKYWPDAGEVSAFGVFTVTFLSSEVRSNYEYRKFNLQHQTSAPRKISQLHFKAWPDHGVPLYPQSLVPILKRMLTFRTENFPIVVHCSAGVGRTGTIILCDISLRMAAAQGFVDVLAMLEHLRNQRPNMVDNVEQFKLAHLVILNCLTGPITSIAIDQDFPRKVEELFENGTISSQIEYIRSSEWEDDAMKTVSVLDDGELLAFPEKDRFSHIVPDKASQVFLWPYPTSDPSPSSTYINAIRVDAFCEPGRFIVTQYPLPHTVGDFWRLVAEKGISVIVCLNEFPTEDERCQIFYPVKKSEMFPVEVIKIKHLKKATFESYHVMTFEVTVSYPHQESKTTTVEIIKYRGWKVVDMVPDDYSFIHFVDEVIGLSRKSKPTLVSCFDGATASGLFIAMSFLIEKIKLERECDVCQAVRSIRSSRKQFTNTEEQLKFLYKASVLFVNDTFGQYSNMDLHGSFS